MGEFETRCPKCNWEPDESSSWECTCGHNWNTFETGGKCPSCNRVWEYTQCSCCSQWSLHEEWYVGVDEVIEKLWEEVNINKKATE